MTVRLGPQLVVVCTNLILSGTAVVGEYFHVAGEKALTLYSSLVSFTSVDFA